ncbi:MAG: cysteine desulfurase [Lachnospiraceae bacterium]|jgi:cysteine desulfurase|nr:cysteine desulfurase [Lachnospiraceae bacterium]
MKEIYFDNSATTKPYPEVVKIVEKTMTEDYGNPSSMHQKGVEAEKYIRDAQKTLASILKVSEKEIYFTSGGTESNNWALIGAASANRHSGMHIITSAMEHPAVSEPLHFLEEQGFRITEIPVDSEGNFDMEAFENALTPDTILVSVMYVNNEIGALTPVEEIGKKIRSRCPAAFYHVDATQAFGHYRIYPKTMHIDMLSASAHKFHGPKGVGFLYLDERVKIRPLIFGGGQQSGMRSGTDNVPGIAGMGLAAKICYENLDAKVAHLYELKEHLREELQSLPGVIVHGLPGKEGAPHIVNASFTGVGSEVLLHSLEDKGIYISAGSACSTHKRSASPTLTAIRAPKAEAESSVRFSFCEENTVGEIDETIEVLKELLPVLRRYRAH